jgi:hypothetical protein
VTQHSGHRFPSLPYEIMRLTNELKQKMMSYACTKYNQSHRRFLGLPRSRPQHKGTADYLTLCNGNNASLRGSSWLSGLE